MANLYQFAADVYPAESTPKDEGAGTVIIAAPGSVETRARRRALEALQASGAFVRRLTVIDMMPLPKRKRQ